MRDLININGVDYAPVQSQTVTIGHLKRYTRQVIEMAKTRAIEITIDGQRTGVVVTPKSPVEIKEIKQ